MFVYTTNRTMNVPRGQAVALATPVSETACISVWSEIASNSTNIGKQELTTDLHVSPVHHQRVTQLIEANIDIFATGYQDLIGTDTVKIKIDTDDHPSIKCQ